MGINGRNHRAQVSRRTPWTTQRVAWPWPVQVERVSICSSGPGITPVSS